MVMRHKIKPGDWLSVCDRSGFVNYASRMRKEWNNLRVLDRFWEIRQPQDFVRGKQDHQAAPHTRPRGVDTFVGPLTTEINAEHAAGIQTITLIDSSRMTAGDSLRIHHNDLNIDSYTVQSVDNATDVTLTEVLRGAVSVGNIVVDYSAVSTP